MKLNKPLTPPCRPRSNRAGIEPQIECFYSVNKHPLVSVVSRLRKDCKYVCNKG